MKYVKYVEVTIDQALALNRGNGKSKVLVAINDLEEDQVIAFVQKTKDECENIIKDAQTLVHNCDDLMDSLMCYSKRQENIKSIRPVGVLSTILME